MTIIRTLIFCIEIMSFFFIWQWLPLTENQDSTLVDDQQALRQNKRNREQNLFFSHTLLNSPHFLLNFKHLLLLARHVPRREASLNGPTIHEEKAIQSRLRGYLITTCTCVFQFSNDVLPCCGIFRHAHLAHHRHTEHLNLEN